MVNYDGWRRSYYYAYKDVLGVSMACEERIIFESAMAMAERTIRRLWITVLVLIALFVASNFVWIAYENQFETVNTEVEIDAEQDGNGVNIVGGGDVSYGPDSKNQD